MDTESLVYRVEPEEDTDRFRVVNDDGRAVVVCQGRQNAEHYATLMNEAYARGFRHGRRSAKD